MLITLKSLLDISVQKVLNDRAQKKVKFNCIYPENHANIFTLFICLVVGLDIVVALPLVYRRPEGPHPLHNQDIFHWVFNA